MRHKGIAYGMVSSIKLTRTNMKNSYQTCEDYWKQSCSSTRQQCKQNGIHIMVRSIDKWCKSWEGEDSVDMS